MRTLQKLAFYIVAAGLLQCPCVGAQELDWTQFYMNLPGTNPGFAGTEDFWDSKVGFRQGGRKLDEQNNSMYVSSYGMLSPAYGAGLKNNSLRLSDPDIYKNLESVKALRKTLYRRHGLGGTVSSRTLGTYRSTRFSLAYAYHLPISPKLRWSFGIRAGYHAQQIGINGLSVRDEINDLFYQQLLATSKARMNLLTADFGSVVYSDRFFVGISTMGLIQKEVGGYNFNGLMPGNYSLQGGGFWNLGQKFEINPVVRLDYNDYNDLTWLTSARLRIKRLVYFGVAYQSGIKMSGLVGITMDGKYSLNYSYDRYLSSWKGFNANMHELIFGVSMFNRYNRSSKFW